MCLMVPQTFASTFFLLNGFVNDLYLKKKKKMYYVCSLQAQHEKRITNANGRLYNINENIHYKKEFGSARKQRLGLHL